MYEIEHQQESELSFYNRLTPTWNVKSYKIAYGYIKRRFRFQKWNPEYYICLLLYLKATLYNTIMEFDMVCLLKLF